MLNPFAWQRVTEQQASQADLTDNTMDYFENTPAENDDSEMLDVQFLSLHLVLA
jgi:hypothetical protein